MDLRQIRPVDHARAAQLAMAVNLDDDAMAALVVTDVTEDERDDSALLLMLAQAANIVYMLNTLMSPEKVTELLQNTLALHAGDGVV